MRTFPVPVPAHEFLAHKSDSDHEKLQVKPVIPEPHEQVGTENDGKWTEPQQISVATSPSHQHVKCVSEKQLGKQEQSVLLHRRPVPTPIRVNGKVHHGLNVVLRLGLGENK